MDWRRLTDRRGRHPSCAPRPRLIGGGVGLLGDVLRLSDSRMTGGDGHVCTSQTTDGRNSAAKRDSRHFNCGRLQMTIISTAVDQQSHFQCNNFTVLSGLSYFTSEFLPAVEVVAHAVGSLCQRSIAETLQGAFESRQIDIRCQAILSEDSLYKRGPCQPRHANDVMCLPCSVSLKVSTTRDEDPTGKSQCECFPRRELIIRSQPEFSESLLM